MRILKVDMNECVMKFYLICVFSRLLIDQKEDILRLTSDHQPCQPAQTSSHTGGPLSTIQGMQQR